MRRGFLKMVLVFYRSPKVTFLVDKSSSISTSLEMLCLRLFPGHSSVYHMSPAPSITMLVV